MNDSQAQIRWLAAVLVVLIVGIGPVAAGLAFADGPELFTVHDTRSWTDTGIRNEKEAMAKRNGKAILLIRADGVGCESDTKVCPRLDKAVVDVPVSADADIENVLARLGNTYDFDVIDGLDGTTRAILPGENFSVKAALLTGALFLIGTLLAIAALAGRRTQRVPSPAEHSVRQLPPREYPRYEGPTDKVEPVVPVPAVRVAGLPGIDDVARAHGTTATVRSHIDDTGGYIALGDVLVWATPVVPGGAITAYPDDDVHVTAAAHPAPLTPPQYGGLQP